MAPPNRERTPEPQTPVGGNNAPQARYRLPVPTPLDTDCLFCAMLDGSVPVDFVYQDEHAAAIADINPQAPTHLLVIPRGHVRDIGELVADGAAAGWVAAIGAVARQRRLDEYRTVCNTGASAGQSVFHLHAHVLAGRPFGWPPG